MKSVTLASIALFICVLSAACTRVSVSIEQQGKPQTEPTRKPPIDGLQKIDPFQKQSQLTPSIRLVSHTGISACPTRDKSVDPISQETDSWCWIASAIPVMRFHDVDVSSQCKIATELETTSLTKSCCDLSTRIDPECSRNGLPEEVFDAFNFQWNWAPGHLEPEELAGQICNDGPFISLIRDEGGGGHSFVVGDWTFDGETLWVSVNDPTCVNSVLGQCMDTPRFALWPYEDYVVGNTIDKTTDTHELSYVCFGKLCQGR